MEMTNIDDSTLEVKIAGSPGEGYTVTRMEPGETRDFPDGYCRPVRGAGQEMLPSILERMCKRHGVAVLVPAGMAEKARKRYQKVVASKEAKDKSPEATIRRLEAEKAQMAAEMKALKEAKAESQKPAEPAKPAEPTADEAEDLIEATTPKVSGKRRGKGSKAK